MDLQNKALQSFRAGVYRHYKGGLYEADHLLRDANDASRVGVHYIGLGVEGAKEGPRHLVRTWDDWVALLHEDGSICDNFTDNICLDTERAVIPRFRYLGPFYTLDMAH